jgi:hypothetical protein
MYEKQEHIWSNMPTKRELLRRVKLLGFDAIHFKRLKD